MAGRLSKRISANFRKSLQRGGVSKAETRAATKASNVAGNDDVSWVQVQKKTFSRWANQYLPEDKRIVDLVEDLHDGLVLAELLQNISDKKVGKLNKKPKIELQKLENLNACIDHIRAHDIPLVNIGSSDIMNGNEKIILGLIWMLILKWEVGNNASGGGKAGLLLWAQRSTQGYKNVDVKDFKESWRDGLAFNALIHKFRPDLINFDKLDPKDGLGNCENAFSIAEKELGIARLLDAEDVVNNPDDKSNIAYMNNFMKKFMGSAKEAGNLKAIETAVAVTRRHHGWMNDYAKKSRDVSEKISEKKTKYGPDSGDEDLDSTEQVSAALGNFRKYMTTEKPGLGAKKAESEGVFATLVTSKRNNLRPDYSPEVIPSELSAQWEDLEAAEQAYERRLLDKYLGFQEADHHVDRFRTKQGTFMQWLEEKKALFDAGELGNSTPAVAAQLEEHGTYENRLKMYEKKLLPTMKAHVDSACAAKGHRGAQEIAEEMSDLHAFVDTVAGLGAEHKAKLLQRLKDLQDVENKAKDYVRQADNLDFLLDDLEDNVGSGNRDMTVNEMKNAQVYAKDGFPKDSEAVRALLLILVPLANDVKLLYPDAPANVAKQQKRLDDAQEGMGKRLKQIAKQLAAEEERDALAKEFAAEAGDFDAYCGKKQDAVGRLSGPVEEQKKALDKLRKDIAGEGSTGAGKLASLEAASERCDQAGVVANPHTPHTIFSLRGVYITLIKAVDGASDALAAEIMAKKSLEISPEQLKEIQEVFKAFDVNGDGTLNYNEVKEACVGAGIDIEDKELEERMKEINPKMVFTPEDFAGFFIQEFQTGGGKEDVLKAFTSLAPEGKMGEDLIDAKFNPISEDLAAYLRSNIKGGDYEAFTEELFSV